MNDSKQEFSSMAIVPSDFIFMMVGVRKADGTRDDEKFFLGRLPLEGEAVEMVFTGRDADTGDLRFQLRVKSP